MIKGHTDIDIWNTGFFINADYFSDDFIIYNNTGKDLTRKTLAHPFFHNNSYKTTYTSFILCLSGTSEIESSLYQILYGKITKQIIFFTDFFVKQYMICFQ